MQPVVTLQIEFPGCYCCYCVYLLLIYSRLLYIIVCSVDLDEPLGMDNGDVLDTDLSASTTFADYVAHRGRLNRQGTF